MWNNCSFSGFCIGQQKMFILYCLQTCILIGSMFIEDWSSMPNLSRDFSDAWALLHVAFHRSTLIEKGDNGIMSFSFQVDLLIAVHTKFHLQSWTWCTTVQATEQRDLLQEAPEAVLHKQFIYLLENSEPWFLLVYLLLFTACTLVFSYLETEIKVLQVDNDTELFYHFIDCLLIEVGLQPKGKRDR